MTHFGYATNSVPLRLYFKFLLRIAQPVLDRFSRSNSPLLYIDKDTVRRFSLPKFIERASGVLASEGIGVYLCAFVRNDRKKLQLNHHNQLTWKYLITAVDMLEQLTQTRQLGQWIQLFYCTRRWNFRLDKVDRRVGL